MNEALETLQRHHVLWFVLVGGALFAWSRWRGSRDAAPRATRQSTGRHPPPTALGSTEERDDRPTTLPELGAQLAELETRRGHLAQQIEALEDEPVSVGAGKGQRTRGRERRSRRTPE